MIGVVLLVSLAVVLATVGWFLLEAAIELNRSELGVSAAGLVIFAMFDLLQARYHEV